jgi:hypothetical protein
MCINGCGTSMPYKTIFIFEQCIESIITGDSVLFSMMWASLDYDERFHIMESLSHIDRDMTYNENIYKALHSYAAEAGLGVEYLQE